MDVYTYDSIFTVTTRSLTAVEKRTSGGLTSFLQAEGEEGRLVRGYLAPPSDFPQANHRQASGRFVATCWKWRQDALIWHQTSLLSFRQLFWLFSLCSIPSVLFHFHVSMHYLESTYSSSCCSSSFCFVSLCLGSFQLLSLPCVLSSSFVLLSSFDCPK